MNEFLLKMFYCSFCALIYSFQRLWSEQTERVCPNYPTCEKFTREVALDLIQHATWSIFTDIPYFLLAYFLRPFLVIAFSYMIISGIAQHEAIKAINKAKENNLL